MRIHFIGIGGVSMRAIAAMVASLGHEVTGSDLTLSGHRAEFVEGAQLVVYTSAVKSDNVELVRGRELGIPIVERAEMLARLAKCYNKTIAVAGTHGKTTTTGMLWKVFQPFAPTVHMGGNLAPTLHHEPNEAFQNTNAQTKQEFSNSFVHSGLSQTALNPNQPPTHHEPNQLTRNHQLNQTMEDERGIVGLLGSVRGFLGGKEFFITEACEYNRSFLFLSPSASIVLNVDMDHTDCYGSFSELESAFSRFSESASDVAIVCGDDAKAARLRAKKRLTTFGFAPHNNYRATNLECDERGCYSFFVSKNGYGFGDFRLSVAGRHNVKNALAVIACADYYGVSVAKIRRGLMEFSGISRRFEYVGERDGVSVFSDYAHHPSEIEASLTSAREFIKGKLIVVFEPHTYTRTASFLPEFARTLQKADKIILLPIYAAREKNTTNTTSLDLWRAIKQSKKAVIHFSTYTEALDYLKTTTKKGETIIFMGAGEIDKASRALIKKE